MALFRGEEKLSEVSISHPAEELIQFDNVIEQFEFRMKEIDSWLKSEGVENKDVAAIAGRGAPLAPLEGGVYKVNKRMLDDLQNMKYSNHASNLGAIMADHLGSRFNVPAFVVDPPTVNQLTDLARISGVPEIERKCRLHALNLKEVCRRVSLKIGKAIEDTNFIGGHLGGGISVAAIQGGKFIDVNDGFLGMGPFSPDRAGALPIGPLVKLAYSGQFTESELLNKLSRESGLKAYLGVSDLREVEKMIEAGDEKAKLYIDSMVYQIAKEIGACAVVLKGNLDAVILTGGMARSKRLIDTLRPYIEFLGRLVVLPGEFELEALAAGVRRVLNGDEIPKEY
jgi:butyrate kinase